MTVERYKELFWHRSCSGSRARHVSVDGSRHKDGSVTWQSEVDGRNGQLVTHCPYCGLDLHAATRASRTGGSPAQEVK
jgi:hypothetical protein